MTYIMAYLATGFVFFAIDFVWLAYVAKTFYRAQLGGLMANEVNLSVAGVFYALYVAGIVIFAVVPALKSGELRGALMFGALFGFFAYATYDLTNLATIRGWPVVMSFVDMAWGTVLTATSATLGYLITRSLVS